MIKVLSYIFLVLFCWIVYPYKWIDKAIFDHRKAKAIAKANKSGRKEYVIQIGKHFISGTKEDMDRIKKNSCKNLGLKRIHYNLFDWKSAVIYTTK